MFRYKRDISNIDEKPGPSKIEVKGPWNANKRSRFVELVIVVDNRKFKENGEDLNKVYRKCKDMANIANALYAPLNIYIALVGVVVWSEYDEITLSTNGDTTLTNFLHYRRERLVKEHPNDNAQLLTGIQFDSGVVGKALKGPICTYEFSGGVSMWHSEVIGLVATTMAHEMGHNFGMEHDTENCKCPEERCIMSPSSSTMKPYFWSSCSLEYLALAFEHGMDYCLRNKPRTLFDSPVCGNGFVEPGEECDCGLKDHCDNPCCNATTCRMFANATCATGECCDFKTCKPKTPGAMCRLSEHECDLPEYCTGTSEFCPKDIYKVDGVPCKVGQSYCYQGSCRTHSDQCRLLWGPSGKKSDNQCYEQNRKGSRHGNCGYNLMNKSYVPCTNEDVRCGMLHCSHLNERLEFGMESVAILSHSFINSGGRIIPCRTALVDLGLEDVDPGLAPEGARCGEDSLCVNKKCMPVASLQIGPLSCPNNCNNKGVCNSLGHCHCDVGWAPPYCDGPGAGGSLDSGPASSPDDGSTISTALFILFLGILPLILVISCIIYLTKDSLHSYIKKSKREEGFIKVERRRSSRPPSRLNLDSKDISGPISVETTNSLTSSPTHALLPRSSTQTSDIGEIPPVSVINSSETKRQGLFSGGVFGLGGLGYRKSQDKLDSPGETPPESLTDSSSKVNSSRSKASNILKSFNKSISFPSTFPSPKFRTSLKKQNSESNKYEVKIEPSQQMDNSPVDPAKIECVPLSEGTVANSSQFLHNIASTSSIPPPIQPKPVLAVAGSKSFSTFHNNNKTKASTLPPSMSLGQVTASPVPVSKIETKVVLAKPEELSPSHTVVDFKNNPKLAFPHSSSFSGSGKLQEEKPIPGSPSAGSIAVKNILQNLERKKSNPSSYTNRNTPGANRTVSSSYSANIHPVQSPFLKKQDPKPTPVTTLTVSPFSQTSQPSTSSSSTVSPAQTKPAVTSTKPLISASKPSLLDSKPSITTSKPASSSKSTGAKHTIWSVMDSEKDTKSESPIPTENPKPENQTKPLEKSTSPIIKEPSNTIANSPLETKPSVKTSEEVSSPSGKSKPPLPSSRVGTSTSSSKPVISRPVLQAATPNAALLIAKAPSTGVSQSSILATKEKESDPFKPPRDKGRRAIFCDPITLPSPTSPNNPPIIHQPSGPSSTDATVGKIITPTWSVQPSHAVADQVQVCNLDGKLSPEPEKQNPTEKSTFSKLISNVKRTPSLGVADRPTGKDKDKSSTLPRKPKGGKYDRNSLRTLEISSPILQSELGYKADLVPVCKSPDLDQPDSRLTPNLEHQSSPSNRRAAPKPPSKPQNDDISCKDKTRSRYQPPWRSNKGNKSSENRENDSQPKVSNSDDSLDSVKPETQSSRSKRPASIATSKPIRPSGPPPKPPPTRVGSEEPSPDDIFINRQPGFFTRPAPLANIRETLSPSLNEPIYDTIQEETDKRASLISQDEFETPLGSPTLTKKSPDTLSTGSSAEEDLMKEILKEVHVKSEGESIYSSLMRKDRKKRRQKQIAS